MNERDGAGLRSSVAAATPSQLRRSSAARTLSGRRGIGQSSPRENLPPFGQKQGYTIKSYSYCDFNINLPKELRPLPCQGIILGGGVKKSCRVWVVTHRIATLLNPRFMKLWTSSKAAKTSHALISAPGIYAACLIRIEYNKYYKNTVKVSASAEASWLVSHAAGSSASGKRKRESVSSSNVVAS